MITQKSTTKKKKPPKVIHKRYSFHRFFRQSCLSMRFISSHLSCLALFTFIIVLFAQSLLHYFTILCVLKDKTTSIFTLMRAMYYCEASFSFNHTSQNRWLVRFFVLCITLLYAWNTLAPKWISVTLRNNIYIYYLL